MVNSSLSKRDRSFNLLLTVSLAIYTPSELSPLMSVNCTTTEDMFTHQI
jgi:hypothetical protein